MKGFEMREGCLTINSSESFRRAIEHMKDTATTLATIAQESDIFAPPCVLAILLHLSYVEFVLTRLSSDIKSFESAYSAMSEVATLIDTLKGEKEN